MRDRDKIEELYKLHGAALVLFATSISGCRGSGQDAVHKVFLKLLDKGLNERVADLKAYLFTSVRNTVLNELKKNDRVAELESDSAWFDPPDHDDTARRAEAPTRASRTSRRSRTSLGDARLGRADI